MQRTGLVIIIKPIEIGHEDITKITVLNSPYFTRKIKSLEYKIYGYSHNYQATRYCPQSTHKNMGNK